MPNMKSRLLLTVIATPVKIKNRQTNRQTNRETDVDRTKALCPDHSIRGYKNNNNKKNKSLDYTTITYRLRTVMQLERQQSSSSTGVVYLVLIKGPNIPTSRNDWAIKMRN